MSASFEKFSVSKRSSWGANDEFSVVVTWKSMGEYLNSSSSAVRNFIEDAIREKLEREGQPQGETKP